MQRHRGEGLSRSELKLAMRRRITHLRDKGHVTDAEVYHLFKLFFQEFLGKRYEFTAAELKAELKNVYLTNDVRNRVLHFVDVMGDFEVCDAKYTVEELKTLLKQFLEIVDLLILNVQKAESFLQKILSFAKKNSGKDLDHRLVETSAIAQKLAQLKETIGVSDHESAVKIYKEIMEFYNVASEEEKRLVYPQLSSLYERLNSFA